MTAESISARVAPRRRPRATASDRIETFPLRVRNRRPLEPHEREARTVAQQGRDTRSTSIFSTATGGNRSTPNGSRFLAASSVTISTLIEGDPSRYEGCLTASLPAFVRFYPLGGGYAAFIRDENPRLPRADFLLNVEPESGGIPPHNRVTAGGSGMKPRRNRCLGTSASTHPVDPAPSRCRRSGSRSAFRRPPLVPTRIYGRVQDLEPSGKSFVAWTEVPNARKDEQVSSARCRDVRDANRFRRVASQFVGSGVAEVRWN